MKMEFCIALELLGGRVYLMVSNLALLLQIDTKPSNIKDVEGCLYLHIDFEDKEAHLRWRFWKTKELLRKIE